MQTVFSIIQRFVVNNNFFNNLLVFILTNLGNLCQFIFQIVCIRLFIPEEFSVFGSINAYISLVSAPVLIIPLLVSKYLIKSNNKNKSIEYLMQLLIKLILISILICAILHPFIKNILGIDKHIYFLVSYITLISSAVISVCFGILQGLKKISSIWNFSFLSLFSKLIFLLSVSYFYKDILLLFFANLSGVILQ